MDGRMDGWMNKQMTETRPLGSINGKIMGCEIKLDFIGIMDLVFLTVWY
jgi:hypothetical protein